MVRLSPAPAVGVVLAALSDRPAVLARPTVTARPVPLLIVPSVTVMLAAPLL
jgi:hypothetical protein